MYILAIIQARMGSSRLPGKVLMPLFNIPVLQHIVERVKQSRMVSETVVATTFDIGDLPIMQLCSSINTRVFCGSSDDVLDRYYQCARLIEPDHVVRITADCPFIDPSIIDFIVSTHLEKNTDYTSNTIVESYPDGEDVEVFRFSALKKAWTEAQLLSEREHVTPYIKKNPGLFNTFSIVSPENYYSKRWTLDNQEDFDFTKAVYDGLYQKNKFFGMDEMMNYLNAHPEIEKINSHIARNEGYQKSLREDRIVNTHN